MTYKLIFLDIDGVLNHELMYTSHKEWEDRLERLGYPNCMIDEEKVLLLNQLIEDTGAKVVVSSTWRLSSTVEELQSILEKSGFIGEVIGKTPYLYYGNDGYTNSVPRGCEIHEWLYKKYGYRYKDDVKFVILDDDSDMLYWQKDNYISVDNYCGMTKRTVFKANKILGEIK